MLLGFLNFNTVNTPLSTEHFHWLNRIISFVCFPWLKYQGEIIITLMSWQRECLSQLTNITVTQIPDTLTSRWRQTLWDRCFMQDSSCFNREHIQGQQLLLFWAFWQVRLHLKQDRSEINRPLQSIYPLFTSCRQIDLQQTFIQNTNFLICLLW